MGTNARSFEKRSDCRAAATLGGRSVGLWSYVFPCGLLWVATISELIFWLVLLNITFWHRIFLAVSTLHICPAGSRNTQIRHVFGTLWEHEWRHRGLSKWMYPRMDVLSRSGDPRLKHASAKKFPMLEDCSQSCQKSLPPGKLIDALKLVDLQPWLGIYDRMTNIASTRSFSLQVDGRFTDGETCQNRHWWPHLDLYYAVGHLAVKVWPT